MVHLLVREHEHDATKWFAVETRHHSIMEIFDFLDEECRPSDGLFTCEVLDRYRSEGCDYILRRFRFSNIKVATLFKLRFG